MQRGSKHFGVYCDDKIDFWDDSILNELHQTQETLSKRYISRRGDGKEIWCFYLVV